MVARYVGIASAVNRLLILQLDAILYRSGDQRITYIKIKDGGHTCDIMGG